MRKVLLWVGLLAVLAVANWAIIGKERVLANGQIMLLELAPRDPRSLLQGDYMILRYALARDIERALGDVFSASGVAVVALDRNDVARFIRLAGDGDPPLDADERRLRYRKRGESLRLAGEAWFFEEGHSELYARAAFGELSVDDRGEAIVIGLRDTDFDRLGPDSD